jgi:hypothetical protein
VEEYTFFFGRALKSGKILTTIPFWPLKITARASKMAGNLTRAGNKKEDS